MLSDTAASIRRWHHKHHASWQGRTTSYACCWMRVADEAQSGAGAGRSTVGCLLDVASLLQTHMAAVCCPLSCSEADEHT